MSTHLWPYSSPVPDNASTVAVVGSSRPRPTRKRSYSQPQEYHPHPAAPNPAYYYYPTSHSTSSDRRDDRERDRERDRHHSSQAPPPRTSSSSGYYPVEKAPSRSSVESHESRGRERERRDSKPSHSSSRHTRTSSSSYHHIEGSSSPSLHRAVEEERRALQKERERQYAHQRTISESSSHSHRSRERSGSQVRWAETNEVQMYNVEDHPSRTARSRHSRSPSPNGILRNSPSGGSSRTALPDYANEPWLTIPSRDVPGRPRSSSGSRSGNPVPSAHGLSERSRRSSITHGAPVYPQATPSTSSQYSSSGRVLRRSLSQDRLPQSQESEAMQIVKDVNLPSGYYQVHYNGVWYQYRA